MNSIRSILHNPLYIGKIRFNQYEDWNKKRRKGKNPDPILVDGEHEAIISEDLWEKVQKLYKTKAGKPPRTFNSHYTLTKLLRCPQCGQSMVASRTKKTLKDGTTKITRYYVCSDFRNKGASVCKSIALELIMRNYTFLVGYEKLFNLRL